MSKKSRVKGIVRKSSEGWVISTADAIIGPYESEDAALKAAARKGIQAKPVGASTDRSEAARRANETRKLKGTASEAAQKSNASRK